MIEQNGDRIRSQEDMGSNPSCAFRSCVTLSKSFSYGAEFGLHSLGNEPTKSLSQVPLELSASSQPW